MNVFEILIGAIGVSAFCLMVYHFIKDWHSIGEDMGVYKNKKDRLDA